MRLRPSALEVGALGCNGILSPRRTVSRPSIRGVPFDLVWAPTRPECTSDTLASFVVQSCGSHFIYSGFQLQPIQRRRWRGGVDGSSVGGLGYVCLISLLLHKIKYDDQWKQQIELNVQALVFIYPLLAPLRLTPHIITETCSI